MKTARLIALSLLVAAAVVPAAGCASSAGPVGDDPAALVPAEAPVFAEATVRPDATQAVAARALLGRVLRTTDPSGALADLLDRKASGTGLSFRRDVEPWLGDRIAVAVTALRGKDADSAVIASSTDDAKAGAALDKAFGGGGERSYRGVDYRVDRDEAGGLVEHRVVIGDEAAFKAAVDASRGDSLADSNALRDARAKVAQDRLAFLYVDLRGLVRLKSAGSDSTSAVVLQALSGALPRTIAAALQADTDALHVDAVSIGTPKGLSTGSSGADALAALPGDAWLGLGVADLGQMLDGVLDTLTNGGGLTGLGVQALLGQARDRTGLDIRRDLLSWMGDAGLFVSGTSHARVGGALVITTHDPARTRSTIAALRRLVAGGGARVSRLRAAGVDAGFTVRSSDGRRTSVALAGDRFVVALGARRALTEAFSPSSRLGSSPALRDAASRLGAGLRPSFFLDVRKASALMGTNGHHADLARYLAAFGAVAGGARDEGDGVTRAHFVATVR